MEDMQEDGITLGQLFKVMFRRWKLLLMVTIGTALVIIMAITFVYNKGKKIYSADFNWTLTGVQEEKYIDGSKFDYKNLVTLDTLQKVKDSDESFKNISVEDLVKNGGISISKKDVRDTKDSSAVTKSYYTITTYQKYYKSAEQAKNFVKAIASVPVYETINMLDEMNYTSNFDSYNKSLIYDNQVSYLKDQYALLNENYKTLVETYGDVKLQGEPFNNNTISQQQAILETYFKNHPIDSLQIEINNSGFVKDYTTYNVILKANIDDLYNTYTNNQEKILNLKAIVTELLSIANDKGVQSLELSAYNEQIQKLTVQNVDIKAEMKNSLRKIARQDQYSTNHEKFVSDYEKLTKSGIFADFNDIFSDINNSVSTKAEFDEKLETVYKNQLETYTNDFKNAQKDVISNNSKVSYENASVIVASGGISSALTVVLSLIVGLVIGCFVNLIIDSKYLHENTRNIEDIKEIKD
ncbi:MAG: hypothetical protein K6G28_04970 [Acholeplasmatales bacterium]|nr:hypothetical protein [Acholeplasmatales bacterium]